MFLKRFFALLATRNREFLRDRSSVGWNILMPVLIIAGFALVFSGDFADQYKVGIVKGAEIQQQRTAAIDDLLQQEQAQYHWATCA